MSEMFLDILTELLEAVAIERGEIQLVERKGTPAKTYYSPESEEDTD